MTSMAMEVRLPGDARPGLITPRPLELKPDAGRRISFLARARTQPKEREGEKNNYNYYNWANREDKQDEGTCI